MDSPVTAGIVGRPGNPVLQIAIPPGSGGVADYASQLAEAFPTDAVVRRLSFKDRLSEADGQHVFLQYSGYGYAKRGAPLWLVAEVRRLKEEGCTVGVFFHETYASGPPWRSAFWLSPAQRWVAKRLARLSDYWLTNREVSYEWLRKDGAEKPSILLPICSNVGELTAWDACKASKAIIFGGSALRAHTYKVAGERLFQWANDNGVVVHDIGPPLPDAKITAVMRGEGVIQHGMLSPDQVSRAMSGATVGVVAYPGTYLAKSSVFAAYCALGLCPVVLGGDSLPADGLVAGQQYLDRFPDQAGAQEVIAVAKAAWDWYVTHCVAVHAKSVEHLYLEAAGKCRGIHP